MKLSTLLTAIAITLAGTTSMTGCEKQDPLANAPDPKTVTIDELAKLLDSEKPPKVYDANGKETREEFGTVPGANLLSSYDEYDDSELKADKADKLVFYCGSDACKAAEGAAKKALLAGYSDVNVMTAGIKGWSKAGKPTSKLN